MTKKIHQIILFHLRLFTIFLFIFLFNNTFLLFHNIEAVTGYRKHGAEKVETVVSNVGNVANTSVKMPIIEIPEVEIPDLEIIKVKSEFSPGNVYDYMIFKGLSEYESSTFIKIIGLESKWQLDARPYTVVNHCYTDTRGWFAIEVTSDLRQDKCEYHGAIQGKVEHSYGLFQILKSNSDKLGCDMSTWQGQVDCAIEVYRQQGFGAWATFYLI